MDPARWRRVEALYHAALEQPADQRPRFLADACEGDDELKDEVHSLLQVGSSAERLMPAPADSRVPIGERLGSFEITGFLGAGGMAEVYRARDSRLNRDVAIKVLAPRFADDPDRLARLEREAQLLASLQHPRIAAIHGLEHVDQRLLLVLELVEGRTLAALLRSRALATEEALDLGRLPKRSRPHTPEESFTGISNRRTSRSAPMAPSSFSISASRRHSWLIPIPPDENL